MTYESAIELATDTTCIRELSWSPEKKVRRANVGDMDYIGVASIEGVFVEDCVNPMDCRIRIYNPTAEDKASSDWEISDCNNKNQ